MWCRPPCFAVCSLCSLLTRIFTLQLTEQFNICIKTPEPQVHHTLLWLQKRCWMYVLGVLAFTCVRMCRCPQLPHDCQHIFLIDNPADSLQTSVVRSTGIETRLCKGPLSFPQTLRAWSFAHRVCMYTRQGVCAYN